MGHELVPLHRGAYKKAKQKSQELWEQMQRLEGPYSC
jgi:hypothetical protein